MTKSTAKAVVGLLSCRCRPKMVACWSGDDRVMVALATRRRRVTKPEKG